MADTIISDAVVGIQDEGLPNISDGNEDWGSAGLRMMLAQAVDSDSYVRSDSELTFTNHDGTNDQVDVTGGVAYLDLTGETVNVQSGLGGSSPPSYDTALPTLPAIPVIAPSTTADLDVQDSTLSSVWIAYATDSNVSGISPGDIYLRSDDTGSVSAPPHPNVEIGQANPDDASADTLLNRFGSPTFADLDVGTVSTTQATIDGQIFDLGWEEDANSPLEISAAASGTITLDGTYDQILLYFEDPGSRQINQMQFRFNGDTGDNYNYIDGSGARTTADNKHPWVFDGRAPAGIVLLSGTWTNLMTIQSPVIGDGTASTIAEGGVYDGTSPLDSITLRDAGESAIDAKMRVYGR